jgi:putative NADH-flavin reductase
MEKNIKIAVIGGTGKSGKYLVRHLFSERFHLRLLIRDHVKLEISDPLIEVIKGDVKDYETVRGLLKGCHAVISTLGLGRTPEETSIFSLSTKNIIRSMKENQVERYIAITGLNVDTPFDQKSPKTKFATDWMYKNYPLTTADKQEEYKLLAESDIKWTLVRLPLIELTEKRNIMAVNLEDCPGDKISATDLAWFLSGQLSDTAFLRRAPFIANV